MSNTLIFPPGLKHCASDVALAAILSAVEIAAKNPTVATVEAIGAVAVEALGNPPPVSIEVDASVSKIQLQKMLRTLAAAMDARGTKQ